jgi:predicted metal-dependent hydrolase
MRWHECRDYLYGVDLFNHGYYWEAHEVWEGLWHACGRGGTTGRFLKGLIRLAAAGVKAREMRTEGVRNHARRAAELFEQVEREAGSTFLGLELNALRQWAREVAETVPLAQAQPGTAVEIVFPFQLLPQPL